MQRNISPPPPPVFPFSRATCLSAFSLSLPPRRPPSYCARRSSLSRSRSPLSFPGSTRLSRSRPTRRKTVELRRAREKVQRGELTGRTYGGRKRRGTSPSKFPRIFGGGAFGTAGLTASAGEFHGAPLLENRTKPEETRETIRGRARFSRKRHSHRLVLQAHLDLAEDTGGEEEEEEDDERPDREITPSSITLSLFLVPESEPRNRRKPTAFEILSCSGRFVQGSAAAAPAERAHPSPKEGKEERRKRERERDREKEKEQGERGRRSKRSERTRAAPSARQQQRPTVVSNVDQRQGG